MQRRDLSLAILAAASGAAFAQRAQAQTIASSSNAQTTAEASAAVSPVSASFPEGDIRRYGASVKVTDNAQAINNALLVSANGGAAAFIPPGIWRYASTANATLNSSMYGVGQASILSPTGCDGITLGPQNTYAGSRFFRDFMLTGSRTDANNGISCNYSSASKKRVTGVTFSNLTIQNFGIGVFVRQLWQSSFEDCFLYNNVSGYYFHGQNVVNSIFRGFIQKGSLTRSKPSFGVLVDSIDGESTQSLHMNAVGIYGYDINLSLVLALYTVIESCDVSICTSVGILVGTVQGGTSIRDCWVQTHSSAATTGIQIVSRGAPAHDKIVIEGCTLMCDTPNPGSIGISVGWNQLGVTTNNNTIGTQYSPFAIGIANLGAKNHVAKFNTIYTSSSAININSLASDVEIGPNIVQNGLPIGFTGTTPSGFSYYAQGTFTITLKGMDSDVAGTIHYAATGRTVTLSITGAPIVGSSASTVMTGTGLPLFLRPASDQWTILNVVDSGTSRFGTAKIGVDGTIEFASGPNSEPFSGSGIKGMGKTTFGYSYL